MALDQCPKETCDAQGKAPCCTALLVKCIYIYLYNYGNVYIYISTVYTIYMFVSIGMYVYSIYIYTYACTHIYTTIHSRGLTRSDLDDTCFKSTLAFSHAFHMCWPELKCNLTLYTLNCWVLKSWDRLNVFEDLWKKRTCSMRQSCDLLSSAPKVPTFHGGLWHVQTCNVETAAERSESIWQGSEWSFVFPPYILSSSRKPWKIWGFSSPWQDWPELQPGASAYLGVCQRCFRISNFWLCDLDPKQCFFFIYV